MAEFEMVAQFLTGLGWDTTEEFELTGELTYLCYVN